MCPLKHAAVLMNTSGSHQVIPLDDVSSSLFPHLFKVLYYAIDKMYIKLQTYNFCKYIYTNEDFIVFYALKVLKYAGTNLSFYIEFCVVQFYKSTSIIYLLLDSEIKMM